MDTFFKLAPLRDNLNKVVNLKIFKKRFNQHKREYFFLQWVIDKWNQLLNEEENEIKTPGFKANYHRKDTKRKATRYRHPYVSGYSYFSYNIVWYKSFSMSLRMLENEISLKYHHRRVTGRGLTCEVIDTSSILHLLLNDKIDSILTL